MIQTVSVFNADATPFAPEVVANPDHERSDALLEFAQDTGLWGLPGAETEPHPEEYQEMHDAFLALTQLRIPPDFGQEEEYDRLSVFSEEEDEAPHPDAVDLNEMFNLMEEANVNHNANDANDAIDNNDTSDEVPPLNWGEITTDFQDYAIDVMVEEGRMEDVMTDEYAISIWASYMADCWDPRMHSELNALAGQNELRGILPSTM